MLTRTVWMATRLVVNSYHARMRPCCLSMSLMIQCWPILRTPLMTNRGCCTGLSTSLRSLFFLEAHQILTSSAGSGSFFVRLTSSLNFVQTLKGPEARFILAEWADRLREALVEGGINKDGAVPGRPQAGHISYIYMTIMAVEGCMGDGNTVDLDRISGVRIECWVKGQPMTRRDVGTWFEACDGNFQFNLVSLNCLYTDHGFCERWDQEKSRLPGLHLLYWEGVLYPPPSVEDLQIINGAPAMIKFFLQNMAVDGIPDSLPRDGYQPPERRICHRCKQRCRSFGPFYCVRPDGASGRWSFKVLDNWVPVFAWPGDWFACIPTDHGERAVTRLGRGAGSRRSGKSKASKAAATKKSAGAEEHHAQGQHTAIPNHTIDWKVCGQCAFKDNGESACTGTAKQCKWHQATLNRNRAVMDGGGAAISVFECLTRLDTVGFVSALRYLHVHRAVLASCAENGDAAAEPPASPREDPKADLRKLQDLLIAYVPLLFQEVAAVRQHIVQCLIPALVPVDTNKPLDRRAQVSALLCIGERINNCIESDFGSSLAALVEYFVAILCSQEAMQDGAEATHLGLAKLLGADVFPTIFFEDPIDNHSRLFTDATYQLDVGKFFPRGVARTTAVCFPPVTDGSQPTFGHLGVQRPLTPIKRKRAAHGLMASIKYPVTAQPALLNQRGAKVRASSVSTLVQRRIAVRFGGMLFSDLDSGEASLHEVGRLERKLIALIVFACQFPSMVARAKNPPAVGPLSLMKLWIPRGWAELHAPWHSPSYGVISQLLEAIQHPTGASGPVPGQWVSLPLSQSASDPVVMAASGLSRGVLDELHECKHHYAMVRRSQPPRPPSGPLDYVLDAKGNARIAVGTAEPLHHILGLKSVHQLTEGHMHGRALHWHVGECLQQPNGLLQATFNTSDESHTGGIHLWTDIKLTESPGQVAAMDQPIFFMLPSHEHQLFWIRQWFGAAVDTTQSFARARLFTADEYQSLIDRIANVNRSFQRKLRGYSSCCFSLEAVVPDSVISVRCLHREYADLHLIPALQAVLGSSPQVRDDYLAEVTAKLQQVFRQTVTGWEPFDLWSPCEDESMAEDELQHSDAMAEDDQNSEASPPTTRKADRGSAKLQQTIQQVMLKLGFTPPPPASGGADQRHSPGPAAPAKRLRASYTPRVRHKIDVPETQPSLVTLAGATLKSPPRDKLQPASASVRVSPDSQSQHSPILAGPHASIPSAAALKQSVPRDSLGAAPPDTKEQLLHPLAPPELDFFEVYRDVVRAYDGDDEPTEECTKRLICAYRTILNQEQMVAIQRAEAGDDLFITGGSRLHKFFFFFNSSRLPASECLPAHT